MITSRLPKSLLKNPSFERAETLENQKVGNSPATKVSKLLVTYAKWAAVAVLFATVNARMGGKPKVLEMLTPVMGGLRSRFGL